MNDPAPLEEIDWRPIRGCSPISVGCANCAGMKAASAAGLTVARPSGPVWSGALRFVEEDLVLPRLQSAPAFVHVCVNGDLFHEAAPDAWIDAVFEGILDAPQHIYSILTKRSVRMRSWLAARFPDGVPAHIHVGVSAERQAEYDARMADLLAAPVATRFVCFYPLLGPIDAAPAFASGALAYALAGDEAERPADSAWFAALSAAAARAGLPLRLSSRIIEH